MHVEIQTPYLMIRSQTLYPNELQEQGPLSISVAKEVSQGFLYSAIFQPAAPATPLSLANRLDTDSQKGSSPRLWGTISPLKLQCTPHLTSPLGKGGGTSSGESSVTSGSER